MCKRGTVLLANCCWQTANYRAPELQIASLRFLTHVIVFLAETEESPEEGGEEGGCCEGRHAPACPLAADE